MNNELQYKNGKLIISYATMQEYLKDLSNIYNILKGTAGSEILSMINLEQIKYSESKDLIPFRILDGKFLPYAETYLLPYKDGNIDKYAYMMKTMIGTFLINRDLPMYAITSGISASILTKYKITHIGGRLAPEIEMQTSGFANIFHSNLKEKKDIELPLTQKIYEKISIKASIE